MKRASAMNRAEKRFNWTEDILAWCHGKYTREQLDAMTLPEVGNIHFEMYMQRLSEINAIAK